MAGSKNLWIEVPPSVAHANTAVLLTGDRFPDVFWDNVLATGADIIVYDNANNKLPRQLVAINTGAKTMELYVKSPSSATAKAYLKMEYDDAGGAEVNDFADYEDYHETYSARVAASADDYRIYYTGAAWATSVNLVTGYSSATVYKNGTGMRFLGLNIPRYSHCVASYFSYTATENSVQVVVNTRICIEKSGTPSAFSSVADYQARRGTACDGADDTQHTNTIDFDNVAESVLDASQDSPSLNTPLQTVVDLYDITNLVVFWDDHDNRSDAVTNHRRWWYSYDGSAAKATLLTVNYIPKLAYAVYTNDPITRTNVPRIARIMLAMHG